ncbi:hypothetical protein F5Y09DRAFT_357534 [Xylaria sp. FL1042]|nr:hypothetical protein F5Y09DRAFT_357534 [Xylaria sp. FL1042]
MASTSTSSPPEGPASAQQTQQQQQQQQTPPLRSYSSKRASGPSASAEEESEEEHPSRKRRRIKLVGDYPDAAGDEDTPAVSKAESREQEYSESDTSEALGSQSSTYSHIIMKVYMNQKLYSIFDHSTKEYIYHAERDADKGYLISYSGKRCTMITDSEGMIVFISPKTIAYGPKS